MVDPKNWRLFVQALIIKKGQIVLTILPLCFSGLLLIVILVVYVLLYLKPPSPGIRKDCHPHRSWVRYLLRLFQQSFPCL